jgi:Leucine-rich repeat (LRR) protein
MKRFCWMITAAVMLFGCRAEDDPAAVARLVASGASLEKDDRGQVTKVTLSELDFQETDALNKVLAQLDKLPSLNTLVLKRAPLNEAGCQSLSHLTGLAELDVSHSSLTSEGLLHISRLTNLERLDLTRTSIDDSGTEQLPAIYGLKVLKVAGTKITDESLRHIGQMYQLEELTLSHTRVTGKGLGHLDNLDNLKTISIYKTDASAGAVIALKRLLPNAEIIGN